MSDFKFKLTGIILVFVTISLVFQLDFKDQVTYVFGKFDINLNELAEKSIEKVLSHATEEIFSSGFYTTVDPELIENKISSEKYEEINDLIKLSANYNLTLIRGYETDGYVIARYYIGDNDKNTILSEYEKKFTNDGYTKQEDKYIKEDIEINMFAKWDCITMIVKGL